MNDTKFNFQPIGTIRSPHQDVSKIPIQPVFCKDIKGTVVLNTQYIDGLKDLHEFSHIHLFYYFNHSQKTCLRLKPYLSDNEHGIFATRAPHRPNKLGMSLVQLDKIENGILFVRGIDILDGTPLLDIKPYIQRFDSREDTKSGWQDTVSNDVASVRGLRDYEGSAEKTD